MIVKNHKWMRVGVVGALALGGCAAAPVVATGDLSLAATKSPVQLLRNEAASRVAADVVAEVRVAEDGSAACFDEFDNPDGTIRQWISSADLVIAAGNDLTHLADDLVTSFTSTGWERRDLSTGESFTLTVLSSADSVAQIQVEASDESEAGVITITSTGPCVATDGPDSDEVRQLER